MPEKKRQSEKDKQAPRREKSNRQEGDRPKKYSARGEDTRRDSKESKSYRGKDARAGASDNRGGKKQHDDTNGDKPFRKGTGRFEDKPKSARPTRSFDRREDESNGEGSFDRKRDSRGTKPNRDYRGDSDKAGKRTFDSRKRSDDTKTSRPSRSFDRRDDETGGDRPFDRKRESDDFKPRRESREGSDNAGKRPYDSRKRSENTNTSRPSRSFDKRDNESDRERPFSRKRESDDFKPGRESREESDRSGKRPYSSRKSSEGSGSSRPSRPFERRADDERDERGDRRSRDDWDEFKPHKEFKGRRGQKGKEWNEGKEESESDEMPLNKYIAHSGECSRRDAAELVKQGKVKVNEVLILDPGHKVTRDDKVTLNGKKLTPQKGLVYILLNKPKGYITTTEDEKGRRTVLDIVRDAAEGSRLFPVGRLDRNTTGLLLITNDGALAQKLSHPSFQAKKIYQVTLDRQLTKADFEKVLSGVELEDGVAHADALAYLEDKNELGIEIHSGKNRIVRRIFESLGYVVEKLDRMMYAGLTKKNLPRGKWRFLDEREIVLLKHFKS